MPNNQEQRALSLNLREKVIKISKSNLSGEEREAVHAEIDSIIFHLYEISCEDQNHIQRSLPFNSNL